MTLIASDTQLEVTNKVLAKLESLSIALEHSAPDIANYLLDISTDLRTHPELTHLLSDEQISPVYQAALQLSGETIVAAKAKKAKADSKITPQVKMQLNNLL